ncbi:MAG: hypothetical protein AB1422_05930 [bacterium]
MSIIIAAKCAPQKEILYNIERAGLKAVELYLSEEILNDLDKTIQLCRNFSFIYAFHAPTEGCKLDKLAELVKAIGGKIVVFHNIYWEEEWKKIVRTFRDVEANLCMENTYSVHEPVKFMQRYGVGRCLDLEHLQMECAGVYEEVFIPVIKQASHIHLTGYTYGSQLWHTHIHYSQEHNLYMLDLLKKAGYSGLLVSEARESLQTYEEFKKLNNFFKIWESRDKHEVGNWDSRF